MLQRRNRYCILTQLKQTAAVCSLYCSLFRRVTKSVNSRLARRVYFSTLRCGTTAAKNNVAKIVCEGRKRTKWRKTTVKKANRKRGAGRRKRGRCGRWLCFSVVFTTSFPRWLSIISLGDAEDTTLPLACLHRASLDACRVPPFAT